MDILKFRDMNRPALMQKSGKIRVNYFSNIPDKFNQISIKFASHTDICDMSEKADGNRTVTR